MRWRRPLARLSFGLVLITASPLAAQPQSEHPREEPVREAERLYAEGLQLLQDGKPEEALRALDASARSSPSPNTDLLRGHALRALNRKVEAMQAYERVVIEAGARVRAGDPRFEETLADAGTWVAFLRPDIAELTIEVRLRSRAVELSVDGERVSAVYDPSANVARARLWRMPGETKVRATHDGDVRAVAVPIDPGTTRAVTLDFVGDATSRTDHFPPLASWISWGVGAAGFVVLAAAGGAALSSMNDLDACRPHCDVALVDQAQTRATVANVGLAVGLAGALIGAGFWLGTEVARGDAVSTARRVELVVGGAPGSFTVQLRGEL